MSIIWCGGEDIDFPNGGAVTINTGRQRAAYARCGLVCAATNKTKAFSPITAGWLHFYCYFNSSSTSKTLAGLVDLSSGKGVFVRVSATTAKLAIATFDGSSFAQLAEESGASFTSAGLFDLQITNFGASSNIKLYFNGTLKIDFTGDSSISGISELNSVAIVGSAAVDYYLSELIVADEDTRLMSLKTLAPNADGDASEWTNGYASIDEVTISDADTIYTDTADQSFQCNLTGMPAGDFICKGVRVAVRATDGVGGIGIQIGVKTNSTVDLGASITLGGVWETDEKLYQLNPVTSNRFTPAEIEALQIAVKSVAV